MVFITFWSCLASLSLCVDKNSDQIQLTKPHFRCVQTFSHLTNDTYVWLFLVSVCYSLMLQLFITAPLFDRSISCFCFGFLFSLSHFAIDIIVKPQILKALYVSDFRSLACRNALFLRHLHAIGFP